MPQPLTHEQLVSLARTGLPVVPNAGWVCSRTAECDTYDFSGAGAWKVSSVLHDSAHHGSAAMLVADLSRSPRMLDTVINDGVWHPAMMDQSDVSVAPTPLNHLSISDVKPRRVLHSMLQAHGQNFPLHAFLTTVSIGTH